jgi:hypothetical protein
MNYFDDNKFMSSETEKKCANVSRVVLIRNIVVAIIVILSLSALSIHYSIIDEENTCQKVDPIGIDISSWLLGAGIFTIGIFFIAGCSTLAMLLFLTDSDFLGSTFFFIITIASSILSILFFIIYSIIGAIVLYRSNIKCLQDGEMIGILSQIMLCFYWIFIFAMCGTSYMKK